MAASDDEGDASPAPSSSGSKGREGSTEASQHSSPTPEPQPSRHGSEEQDDEAQDESLARRSESATPVSDAEPLADEVSSDEEEEGPEDLAPNKQDAAEESDAESLADEEQHDVSPTDLEEPSQPSNDNVLDADNLDEADEEDAGADDAETGSQAQQNAGVEPSQPNAGDLCFENESTAPLPNDAGDDPLGVRNIEQSEEFDFDQAAKTLPDAAPEDDFVGRDLFEWVNGAVIDAASSQHLATHDSDVEMADHVDDQEESRKADEDFQKHQRDYQRLKRRRSNTQADDIAFMRRENEYKRRKTVEEDAAADSDEDDDGEEVNDTDNALFIPENLSDVGDAGPYVQDEDLDEELAPMPRTRKRGRPRSVGNFKKQPAKRGRPKKDQAQQQLKTTPGKRMTKKQRQEQSNKMNPNSFGDFNVFAAAQSNRARSEQPRLGSSKKKEVAMKELLASIPEDAQESAKIDQKQLAYASKQFGHGLCLPRQGEWRVKGMKSLLSHYQMLGSSFMREREAIDKSTGKPLSNPPGGLQCDAMGLGKTVMSIAAIMSDRYLKLKEQKEFLKKHPNAQPPCIATLIVAPSSILHQWRDEFRKHADLPQTGVGAEARIYAPATDDVYDLTRAAVVLTTYSQVMKSYPKKEFPVELITAAAKDMWWREYFEKNKGPLHQVRWRRVILDEATAIKNFRSQTSAGCAELPGKFKWILTGTPAMNALDEFYSYFRFLRVPNCNSFKLFKKNFTDDVEGKERLIAFLRPLMLRRTHKDTLFGSKLLNLPEPTQHTFTVPLDDLHWEVYRIIKERFIERINVISRKEGGLKCRYSNVLTLLLRLRQFVAHPLLIQDSIRDLLEDGDFKKITEKLDEMEKQQDNSKETDRKFIIVHMRRMLAEKDDLVELEPMTPLRSAHRGISRDPPGEQASSSTVVDLTAAEDETTTNGANGQDAADHDDGGSLPAQKGADNDAGADFGLRDDFFQFLDELRREGKVEEAKEHSICSRCNKIPKNPVVTSCHHTYCAGCVQADSMEAIERNVRYNKCKRCGLDYTGTQRYQFEAVEENMPRVDKKGPVRTELKKPKRQDVIAKWIDTNGNMLASAKTRAFKAQIMNWSRNTPGAKIIVYTQFITMMEILAKVCEIEGWACLKYHGGMNTLARNNTVKKFSDEPFTILFATLTTGGVGLNLTMATRVLMIDPWWNEAVEQQAFCRTYRRGQEKKTKMTRFAAQGTVDEHILKLQERKKREITSVMGEEQFVKSLPMNDLLRLFGPIGEDEHGNPFIFPEDGGERGPARWVPHDETEGMADATDQEER